MCPYVSLWAAGSVWQTAVMLHGTVVAAEWGSTMGPYGSLWVPMDAMGPHGVLWVAMGCYGSPCVAGSVRQTAVTLHGAVVAMGQCYVSLCVPMGPYVSPWGRYGSLCVPMCRCVSLCVSMCLCVSLCVPMALYVPLWGI